MIAMAMARWQKFTLSAQNYCQICLDIWQIQVVYCMYVYVPAFQIFQQRKDQRKINHYFAPRLSIYISQQAGRQAGLLQLCCV